MTEGLGASSPAGDGTPDAARVPAPEREFAELRELLLGAERARLDDLDDRVTAQALTPEQLARQLPEAIVLRAGRDKQLARALAPTVENAIRESVRRRPGDFAAAIFPVLGPAIRRAIADTMAELVSSINRAVEHSFSARGLRWRLESWRTGVPYAQVVLRHALVYRVEQVFLVHAETGLLLAQASPPDLAVPDADLVSAMLTAIRDFVGDSFKQEQAAGGLRTFSVGELTVMVEPGPRALLAAVVRGQPADSFLHKMQETIEGLHAQFGRALADFDGDTAPFGATQPLLQDCLVTVLDTDAETGGGTVNWRPLAIGVAIALVVVGALYALSAARWRRAMAALDATPGLVRVTSERPWGSWSIRGLRDPDAAWPSAVIAAAGADTTKVHQQWEPYLSLDPRVTVARAARMLGRPVGVEFALRGDTVVVTGQASLGWANRVAAMRALPPGIGTINDERLEIDVPAGLRPLVDSLARSHVLFDMGSSVPGAPGSDDLTVISRRLAQLQAGVSALGGRVQLAMTGRTDATGTDAANEALSRQRAEAVLRSLATRLRTDGLSLLARAAGTSVPLDAPDSASRARINRSVSFEARLLPHTTAGARPR